MLEFAIIAVITIFVVGLLNISQMPTREILQRASRFCIIYSAIALVIMGLNLLPFDLPELLRKLCDKYTPSLLSAVCYLSGLLVGAILVVAEKRRWMAKRVTLLVVAVAFFVLNVVNIFTAMQSAAALMLFPTVALILGAVNQLRENDSAADG